MIFDYTIHYKSQNSYENPVHEAVWQFLVSPENNETQEIITSEFSTSVDAQIERSINSLGFETERIHCIKPFENIYFEGRFILKKKEINPFNFQPSEDHKADYQLLESILFKTDHEPYLKQTGLTRLPKDLEPLFIFDRTKSVFDNLLALNEFVYNKLFFKSGVTHVGTLLEEIVAKRQGVCQDFTHLFCALARQNGVPAHYVSGYLHQGNGFFGDSQMHAWAEAFVPGIGWVGFDPTNNMLANHNHIKVAHGKDYNDCSPLKGVVFSTGSHETTHEVLVKHNQ